jgi:cytochrome c553
LQNNNKEKFICVDRIKKKLEQQVMRFTKLKFTGGVVFLIALFSLPLTSGLVNAQGNADTGSDKARACQVCHGKGGKSTNPTYPRLAGQHAKYIIKQLKAFKSGIRKDPIMNGMAATLSEQDMEDVAAYFEGNS